MSNMLRRGFDFCLFGLNVVSLNGAVGKARVLYMSAYGANRETLKYHCHRGAKRHQTINITGSDPIIWRLRYGLLYS